MHKVRDEIAKHDTPAKTNHYKRSRVQPTLRSSGGGGAPSQDITHVLLRSCEAAQSPLQLLLVRLRPWVERELPDTPGINGTCLQTRVSCLCNGPPLQGCSDLKRSAWETTCETNCHSLSRCSTLIPFNLNRSAVKLKL